MVIAKHNIEVYKYGGTSLQTQDHFKAATEFLASRVGKGSKVVAVVSAQAGHTDELIKKITSWAPNCPDREYDAFISLGELQSASLLAAMIYDCGTNAISINAYQAGISSSSHHKNSWVQSVDAELLHKYFAKYDVLVIPGFQGINHMSVTTLGRGGSDISATAIAYALRVSICNILTDVSGIYKTHPNYTNKRAKLIWAQILSSPKKLDRFHFFRDKIELVVYCMIQKL